MKNNPFMASLAASRPLRIVFFIASVVAVHAIANMAKHEPFLSDWSPTIIGGAGGLIGVMLTRKQPK